MTTLGYGDLPFNAGMWRPISIDAGPPGTIINAIPPPPVSSGHGRNGGRIVKLVKYTLTQALSLSRDEELRSRIAGAAHDSAAFGYLYGSNRNGSPCVLAYQDPAVGTGGGAQSMMDGQEFDSSTSTVGCGVTDVENHETADPVLFLWRRLRPSSGGPGLHRGGQGIDQAYMLRDTDELRGWVENLSAELPPARHGGGLPGSAGLIDPIFQSNVEDVTNRGIQSRGLR
jgi:N-methylhydantoinase B